MHIHFGHFVIVMRHFCLWLFALVIFNEIPFLKLFLPYILKHFRPFDAT